MIVVEWFKIVHEDALAEARRGEIACLLFTTRRGYISEVAMKDKNTCPTSEEVLKLALLLFFGYIRV